MAEALTITAADSGDLGATCCHCGVGRLGIEPRFLWGCRGGATVSADPDYYVCRECFGKSTAAKSHRSRGRR